MVPEKIQALLGFIDFLDAKKAEFIGQYLPLCTEIQELDSVRSKLRPNERFRDKLQYDAVQTEISAKFKPIEQHIYSPICNRLLALEIWSGDGAYASIWNNNFPAIVDFRGRAEIGDVAAILDAQRKYVAFRTETDSAFLCLGMILDNLDEVLDQLFSYFAEEEVDSFASFRTDTVQVANVQEALEMMQKSEGKRAKFALPKNFFQDRRETVVAPPFIPTINNHINMGDNYNIGNIDNSGNLAIGTNIRIGDSAEANKELIQRIDQLLGFLDEAGNNPADAAAMATAFGEVKNQALSGSPDHTTIATLLSSAKALMTTAVFAKDVTDTFNWILKSLNLS